FGVRRVHHLGSRRFGTLDALVKVERAPIPVRILVNDILVVIKNAGGWIRAGSLYAPTEFRTRNQRRKEFLTGPRILAGRVNLSGGFHLRSSQTRSVVLSFTKQDLRIELTLPRIFDKTILDSVELITRLECGFMDGWIFAGWAVTVRILQRARSDLQSQRRGVSGRS